MDSEIIITGMSGRFPESDNISEFSDNLYNKVNLLVEDNRRWEPGLYGLPRRMGMLKDISKFDNQFFGVHHKQAHQLDPQARILLELTYESIVDAGYDPDELRGNNIGVFIGNCSSESDEFFTIDPKKINGYAMTGCCRAMFANRISYTFDFKGPSFLVDTACSSSALALYEAVMAMRRGECEAAIVGGANLCLRPGTALQFYKLNMLSDDGMCKSFDAACNGYGRSEAVCTLFLQKADAARRNYASIIHVKTNTDGYKEQGVTFPSAAMQKLLITEVYDECKLDPLKVSYVESHGTGTPAGDPIEMSAIADIFCKDRKEPLLVGTVKSNMGHSEPSSGICGIIKVIIGMEKGLIPPNLHYTTPNPDIKSLIDGEVKIVTDPTPWDGGYAAFSCFGFGGVNIHGVLKSNPLTPVLKENTNVGIPQLALYNGRTEESVQSLFDYLDENETPREFFTLLHKSVYTSLQMKPFRGYKILAEEQSIEDVKKSVTENRPLWYIFSGMGTQWPGMAKQLMNLEVFANSVNRSAEVLKPYGLNLIDLVTNGVKDTSNVRSIIPAFVSIAAVQVALVDVLKEMGLQPDGIVGHSVGELGCAYADGCFTAEQMVLAAYWRGKAVEDSNLEEGAMAALGVTWSQANKCCPKDIYPSCHNAEDSVTISGPKDSVKTFVEALKAENVFAREVDSCGYAFHSQYIYPAAKKLQTALEKVIPNPKQRSSRWISSSYPEDNWNAPETKVADASYFVHNLVSPVLFHEALHYVPKNAIVLEIAPHHLLQAILKRVIGPNAEYIGMMKRYVDNTVHLLSSIGRLYTSGFNPDIEKLYPVVKLPVPRSTPMISPLIKWDHSETWSVAKWDKNTRQSQMIVEINVGPQDSPDHYILGHCIDGRHLYPATGYIVLVWRAFAEIKNREMNALPVIFEDVKIHRATLLSESASTKFIVDITNSGGEFEISENGMTICTGHVYTPEDMGTSCVVKNVQVDKKVLTLNHSDIYKELKLKGYDYGPTFQGVVSADLGGNQGLLKWNSNWVVFLDTILQFTILGTNKRALYLPTRIQNLTIDPIAHIKAIEENMKNYGGLPVNHEKLTGQCFSGGVQLKNLKASFAPRQPCKQSPVLEQYQFVPYNETCVLSKSDKEHYECYIQVCSSVSKMILELSGKNKDQISDVMNGFKEADDALIANYLKSYTDSHVLLKSLCGIMNTATSKDLTRHVKNFVNSYLSDRENDILSHTMLNEVPLRTVIDIVLENATSRKLKVAEVAEGSLPLSSKIDEYMQTLIFNINYSIAHSNIEILDKDYLPHNAEVKSWDHKLEFEFKDIDLFVLKYLNSNKKEFQQILENAAKSVRSDGFVAILQRTHLVPAEMFLSAVGETVIPIVNENDMEQIFRELKLVIVSKKSDSFASTLYLLRKVPEESFKESVINITVNKYDKWVNQLREKMKEIEDCSIPERVWLVSEGSNHNGIIGLVNCLRQEPGGSSIRCVFTNKETPEIPNFNFTSTFHKDLFEKNLVMNIFRKGSWGSYRHILCKEDYTRVETEHAYLNVLTRGDLSSLTWVDSPMKYFTSSEKAIMCQVYYASLNFRDIMLASGKLPPDAIPGDLALQDCILGFEFSGRRCMDGQRVMGILSHKGMATTVGADPFFLWDIPDEWTLEEASTVSVAYSTAYYALVARGNLRKGEKVLIHSGSGGVGQAAIAICLSYECEVYTTVGSAEKREFLKKRFPQLKDRNFCNSRDTSFEQYILKETNGEGVDAVLNSLADEKLKASLNCLAVHGRFLEIGKYDLSNNTALGMAVFLKNISFHGILLDALFDNKCTNIPTKLEVVNLVKQGIKNGVVKPLNTILFNHDQAEQAFRYMASGRHIGKVILRIKEEEPQKKIIPAPVRFSAITRTSCNPQKTYVIIGGLGGFGLELSQWLVERGAKNIVLTSRSGIKSGYQKLCIDRWTSQDVNIVISTLNATKSNEAEMLLQLAAKHGTIGGIFNLALVLRDAFMNNQTVQNYVEVCESKVQSTKNLDLLSRELCPKLDWFVCFSSVSCGRGNAGQSNYGYANSVMERICEDRTKEGLPGLAIQWGAIGDVGVIQDTVGSDVVIGGTIPQRITSCLSVLDKFLHQNQPIVSSFVPYRPSETSSNKTSKHNILPIVGNIFGIKDITSISPEISLGELGMDSLMGVELKQFLERDFELVLSIPELRQLKIKDLKKLEGNVEESKVCTEKTVTTDSVSHEKNSGHFNSLLSKQLVPSETIVHMNTVKTGLPLFIVHPIEGIVSMLHPLAQLLPCPVYGIQCTPEASCDSVEDLASWYWKIIKTINIPTTSIYLAGYSFGASVAFEMSLQADRDPKHHLKVSSLIMLEGSPTLVTSYAREHESHFMQDSQVEGEVQALFSFAYLFCENNIVQKKDLLNFSTYAERVQYSAEKINSLYPNLEVQDIKEAFHLYYKKLLISLKYTPKYKLKRDVTLIKASEGVDMAKTFSEVYDLDKVCDGKITSHTVKGTHNTFIQGKGAKEVSNLMSEIFSH